MLDRAVTWSSEVIPDTAHMSGPFTVRPGWSPDWVMPSRVRDEVCAAFTSPESPPEINPATATTTAHGKLKGSQVGWHWAVPRERQGSQLTRAPDSASGWQPWGRSAGGRQEGRGGSPPCGQTCKVRWEEDAGGGPDSVTLNASEFTSPGDSRLEDQRREGRAEKEEPAPRGHVGRGRQTHTGGEASEDR